LKRRGGKGLFLLPVILIHRSLSWGEEGPPSRFSSACRWTTSASEPVR